MSTPIPPLPTVAPPARAAAPQTAPPVVRGSVRLRLVTTTRPGNLDGGWWPRSRDLATELVDLADHLPAHLGRLTHVQCSGSDWDGTVERVPVGGRTVTVVSRPHDTHHVDLATERTTLRLLVVPPGFNDADGEEALLAAATPGNNHSARDLLKAVTDEADVDPRDHWRHDGTAGWGDAR